MTDKPQKKDMRKVKCPYCEEQLPRGEAIRHTNGRYYHKECYEKNKGESDHYRELIAYICEDLYKIKRPSGMILMQIKRFREEFDYKYKGMELALKYFYEILGNEIHNENGVGIIPYIYEEATEQYIQQLKINESAQNEDNYKTNERVVFVSPRKEQTKKLIDIDSI